MSQRINNLNKIISVLHGGAEFYRKSARSTDDAEHEQVFVHHAELRESVARELSRIVDEAGGEPSTGSTSEKVHSVATQVGTIFGDKESNLVSGLEEHEDRTLAVFREVVHHPDSGRDEPMLRDYMAQFEDAHERMRAYKLAS